MSAPERVWIEDERPIGGQCHVHTQATEGVLKYATEYRRADLPPTDAEVMAHPKVQALVEKAQAALDLNDNTSPFGGEIQRDRIERTLDEFRAALAAIQEVKP